MAERPAILLYSETLDEDMLEALRAAGYLPIRCTGAGQVRFLTAPMAIPEADLSVILAAALDALLNTPSGSFVSTAQTRFACAIAKRLLAKEPPQ